MVRSPDQGEIGDRPSDDVLVAAAQRALPAFEPLYRRYVQDIYRFCLRRLGCEPDAADATSAVFVRAIGNIGACQPTTFRPWLYAIARNVVIDHYRSARPSAAMAEAYEIADQSLGPEELTIRDDQRRSVERALHRLPEGERSVIELRLAGLSAVEVAAALGKTRNAVDQAQFRAVTHLREVLSATTISTGTTR